jgi:hypothetical protein
MPRKLPTAYIRKLNEEQKIARTVAAKRITKESEPKDPDAGKLKGFKAVCQTCGAHTQFTVDKFGYATCSNCRAIASYRLGHLA